MPEKKLPKAYIDVYTNGIAFTIPVFQRLLESGVDHFKIARHVAEMPETYTKTIEYIKNTHPDFYRNGLQFFLIGADQSIPLSNRGGLVEVKSQSKPNRATTCNLGNSLTIDVEGNAVLCCNDYYSEHSFGNMNQEPLRKIWNKPEYKKARAKIKAGLWPYQICKKCMSF